jgi:hypothetical protein
MTSRLAEKELKDLRLQAAEAKKRTAERRADAHRKLANANAPHSTDLAAAFRRSKEAAATAIAAPVSRAQSIILVPSSYLLESDALIKHGGIWHAIDECQLDEFNLLLLAMDGKYPNRRHPAISFDDSPLMSYVKDHKHSEHASRVHTTHVPSALCALASVVTKAKKGEAPQETITPRELSRKRYILQHEKNGDEGVSVAAYYLREEGMPTLAEFMNVVNCQQLPPGVQWDVNNPNGAFMVYFFPLLLDIYKQTHELPRLVLMSNYSWACNTVATPRGWYFKWPDNTKVPTLPGKLPLCGIGVTTASVYVERVHKDAIIEYLSRKLGVDAHSVFKNVVYDTDNIHTGVRIATTERDTRETSRRGVIYAILHDRELEKSGVSAPSSKTHITIVVSVTYSIGCGDGLSITKYADKLHYAGPRGVLFRALSSAMESVGMKPTTPHYYPDCSANGWATAVDGGVYYLKDGMALDTPFTTDREFARYPDTFNQVELVIQPMAGADLTICKYTKISPAKFKSKPQHSLVIPYGGPVSSSVTLERMYRSRVWHMSEDDGMAPMHQSPSLGAYTSLFGFSCVPSMSVHCDYTTRDACYGVLRALDALLPDLPTIFDCTTEVDLRPPVPVVESPKAVEIWGSDSVLGEAEEMDGGEGSDADE